MTDGWLRVDKPVGPTSHDAIARIRRRLGIRRVGHTGTLDPPASGLLLVLVGRATRLARFAPATPKRYSGRLRLGLETTTDDLTGEPVSRHEGTLPDSDAVRAAASTFVGDLRQVPPAVSAVKIGGRRLYRSAREGRPVEAPPRSVRVLRWDLEPGPEPALWDFEAEVSSGTYLRALARDLGRTLGCGGALHSLRRTGIGPLVADGAWDPFSEAPAPPLEPIDELPLTIPDVLVDAEQIARFLQGVAVPLPDEGPPAGANAAARDSAGRLLGIGAIEADRLRPRVVLAGEPGA